VKRCPSCGETKPASDYGRNRSLGDGLSFYCLTCNRAKSNAHYRKRRQAMGKKVRDHSWVPEGFQWCPSCKEAKPHEDFDRSTHTTSGLSSWCKACKSVANRDAYFYRKYNLTRHELLELRTAQQDRCGICGDPEPQHLDHDHSTGKIRMLLCQRCNQGLGLFRDDPYLLHVAGLYVEGHRQEQAFERLAEADRAAEDGPDRSAEPPVGSQRRPGTHGTSARTTGRTSGARRRQQAGEADG
jgi:Recombination endonuclease VII